MIFRPYLFILSLYLKYSRAFIHVTLQQDDFQDAQKELTFYVIYLYELITYSTLNFLHLQGDNVARLSYSDVYQKGGI